MKKLLVFSLAAMLVVAFCVPAYALENVFGGYWRTRAVKRKDFDGSGNGTQDVAKVDTRTRIYYTAVLHENLKFVNKFEFDAAWGKAPTAGSLNTYGDFGADDKAVEVKNSYVDFNIAPINTKIGVFGRTLGRGFIFDDDTAGVEIKYQSDMLILPFHWFKGFEGYVGNAQNKYDVDVLGLNPVITVAESWNIQPHVFWEYSDNASNAIAEGGTFPPFMPDAERVSLVYLGLNVDGSVGPAGLWFTGIYQTGKIHDVKDANGDDVGDMDVKAYVVAAGGDVPIGPASIHGQAFYASGDAASEKNGDFNGYFGVGGGGVGNSYYWSEIMGYGIFDWDASAGSPADNITNLWAVNLGASIKPFDKLTITGDLWYAEHAVDDAVTDEKKLGFEADLRLTYQLVEGMNVDLVGAYLWAGDATSTDGNNDKDPYEIGTQFSLSF